ncbi:hypothetical protein HGP14_24910 [Rhizobium sp. P32RR-XVIII]|uniref:hypothetical protein n=1 Tax=Rhizobium sp. P32RR-XVIII TaxID=2726738 RepID=UPI0014566084|nr:hypothetical protein [Rhizobium sp. P32RR-XVIII]NLS06554.1 hypothetical protein [Rhizobium sp. P32RR-XVIII]
MTQETNRIESQLIPLKLFPDRISEGWTTAPTPDAHSAPDSGSEAHLMAFSFNKGRSAAPLDDQAMQSRTSAATLYVTGSLFELFCYTVNLDRLVTAMGEQPAAKLQ